MARDVLVWDLLISQSSCGGTIESWSNITNERFQMQNTTACVSPGAYCFVQATAVFVCGNMILWIRNQNREQLRTTSTPRCNVCECTRQVLEQTYNNLHTYVHAHITIVVFFPRILLVWGKGKRFQNMGYCHRKVHFQVRLSKMDVVVFATLLKQNCHHYH